MKQKFVALKLYLIGLAAGLFVVGWSAIARTDEVATTTANVPATNNQVASNQVAPNTTRQQRQLNLQPIPSMPRFRTRTS